MVKLSSDGKVLTLTLGERETSLLELGLEGALGGLFNLYKTEVISFLEEYRGKLDGTLEELEEGKRVQSSKGETVQYDILSFLNSSPSLFEVGLEYSILGGRITRVLDSYYSLIITKPTRKSN